jgi:GTP pyrophosphokinase
VDYEKLYSEAMELVIACFKGVVDKAEKPYIYHCLAVSDGAYAVAKALELNEEDRMVARIAGLLHDVVEDCDVSVDDIENQFGAKIALIVGNVSKENGEVREEYFKKVFSDKLSMIVKFADSNHNSQLDRLIRPNALMVRKCAGYAKFNAILSEKLGLV